MSVLVHLLCQSLVSHSPIFTNRKKNGRSQLSFFSMHFSFSLWTERNIYSGVFLCCTAHIVIFGSWGASILLLAPPTDCTAVRQRRLGQREGKGGAKHRLEIQTSGSFPASQKCHSWKQILANQIFANRFTFWLHVSGDKASQTNWTQMDFCQ